MILRLLLALTMLAWGGSGRAENWQWIAIGNDSPERIVVYVDLDSMERDRRTVRAISYWIFESALDNGEIASVVLADYDCARRSWTLQERISFNDRGDEVTALKEPQRPAEVRPGTVGGQVLAFACGEAAARSERIENPFSHAATVLSGETENDGAGSGERVTSGTGFFVGPAGTVLTAYHVVEGASEIAIRTAAGQSLTARVERVSPANDLAVLRVDTRPGSFLGFAPAGAARTGDRVFTLGYPVVELLGASEPRFAEGTVSALSGADGEDSWLQISVPVQPGNSGGPLLNESGQVVGIVTAQARVEAFLERTGTLPQNINWAVKAEYASPLLGSLAPAPVRTRSDGIALARSAVVLVVARREEAGGE